MYLRILSSDNILLSAVGIVVEDPVCLPTSNENVLIGIGVFKTEYINLDTSAIEICCPTQGEEENMQWYADNIEVSNSTKYVIGSNFLRVSGEFVDGCVTYTCRAEFSSKNVRQSTEVCAGSKLYTIVLVLLASLSIARNPRLQNHPFCC